MNARDVMSASVISAQPEMLARDVARLLLDHKISAVPVLDESGAPIGMVSEGDLIGREEGDREARRDWWLTLVANRENPDSALVQRVLTPGAKVRDIMVGPVVTVDEETDVREIARLLAVYRIKRVPVVRGGRVVGIVSRADLLRALAAEQPAPLEPHKEGLVAGAVARLDELFLRPRAAEKPPALPPAGETLEGDPEAEEFQHLVAAADERQIEKRREAVEAAHKRLDSRMHELASGHVSDEAWRALLRQAREAAAHGAKEFLLLRFPSELLSDGGRAINVTEADWPATLRGEAAEVFLRFEHDLKPRGFRLSARILDFPGGKPGDTGLFLVWGV